jgi:hypothetical protein
VVRSFATATAPGPGIPELASPASGAGDIGLRPDFVWNAVSGATDYQLALATAADFSGTVITETLTATSWSVGFDLAYGTTYYWRVRARDASGYGEWSAARSFTTRMSPADTQTATVTTTTGVTTVPQPPTLTTSTPPSSTSSSSSPGATTPTSASTTTVIVYQPADYTGLIVAGVGILAALLVLILVILLTRRPPPPI